MDDFCRNGGSFVIRNDDVELRSSTIVKEVEWCKDYLIRIIRKKQLKEKGGYYEIENFISDNGWIVECGINSNGRN